MLQRKLVEYETVSVSLMMLNKTSASGLAFALKAEQCCHTQDFLCHYTFTQQLFFLNIEGYSFSDPSKFKGSFIFDPANLCVCQAPYMQDFFCNIFLKMNLLFKVNRALLTSRKGKYYLNLLKSTYNVPKKS